MFLHFLVVLANKYYIKLYEQEKYIRSRTAKFDLPTLGSFEDRQSFAIQIPPKMTTKKVIKADENETTVLDIAESKETLIYYPVHYGDNQLFEIVPYNYKGVYYIMSLDRCLTWIEDDLLLKLRSCSKSKKEQLFEFVCSDCEDDTVDSVQIQLDGPVISVQTFLTTDTTVMISNLEKMVAQLTECFTANGTCHALDDSTKNLFCYSPYDKIPHVYDLWPDYKVEHTIDTTISAINKKT